MDGDQVDIGAHVGFLGNGALARVQAGMQCIVDVDGRCVQVLFLHGPGGCLSCNTQRGGALDGSPLPRLPVRQWELSVRALDQTLDRLLSLH